MIGATRSMNIRTIERASSKLSVLSANRFLSTTSPPESQCPLTGTSASSSSGQSIPKLQKVPSLPFLGSTIHQYSKTPKMGNNMYQFFPEMRRRYGDFYSMGWPGIGKDIYGTTYVLSDPKEMHKVIQNEGTYPSGAIESQWSFIKFNKDHDTPMVKSDGIGFFGRGEEWKRFRSFLQTDMLSPKAARGYVPGIVQAAEIASKGLPANRDDLNTYATHCAFDMFNTFMFGELTRVTDPNTPDNEENLRFCEMACTSLEMGSTLSRTSYDNFVVNKLGIKTEMYKTFENASLIVREIGLKKTKNFMEKKKSGSLNENEKMSYMARAIDRQSQEGSNVSEEEMMELCFAALNAAVDTTSSILNLNLLQVACRPDVQEKLYDELSSNISSSNGHLTADTITRSNSPYLHAVVRETHRLTPGGVVTVIKRNARSELEIHGIKIPKDSAFMLDSYSIGMDPDFVEDPEEFRPERWLPDAVKARTGTKAEVLDHLFFKEPFSQGARRCPGSRVASNEIFVMLSQSVLDWKMISPVESYKDVEIKMATLMQPEMPSIEFVPR